MSPRQLTHDTTGNGEPCRRCGLRYSIKNAYVPCFLEGETLEEWRKRIAPSGSDLAKELDGEKHE